MHINPAQSQPPRINELLAQQTREIAGEREHDGDADDMSAKAVMTPAFRQLAPEGLGTKVDVLA
jgi:hypothetical protein